MLHFSVQSKTEVQDGGPRYVDGSHPWYACLHLETNDKLQRRVVHRRAPSLRQTWVTEHVVSD